MSYGEFWTVGDGWENRERAKAKPQEARIAKAKLALARLTNTELEAFAQAAIDLLDERCDPDEDCCQAGDDGCGGFYVGDGAVRWGSHFEAASIAPVFTYGEDQREYVSPVWGNRRLPCDG